MSGAITEPGGHPARPGRHRRSAGANTWTPEVRPREGSGRHQADQPAWPEETPAAPVPLIAGIIDPGGDFGAPEPPVERAGAEHISGELTLEDEQAVSGMTPLGGELTLDDELALAASDLAEEHERPLGDLLFGDDDDPAPADEALPDDVALTDDEQAWTDELFGDDGSDEDGFGSGGVEGGAVETEFDDQQTGPIAAVTTDEPPTVRRTKVTLTPAVAREDDVRVYLAPPLDGLSKFDLGTIPASVTPPRSWRKAAWFATVSSGGVVVALLVAGSYLVGQPPTDQNVAINGWPRLPGVQYDDGFLDAPSDTTDRTTASPEERRGSTRQRISDAAAVSTPGSTTLPAMPGPSLTSAPTGTSSSMTTTTQEPQKPPPTSASRNTRPAAFYSFPPDAETMGDRSEIFFNEITEDPEKAWQQTGGEMYAEGPDSIAARYAEIAYFTIEHVYIDQQKRITVSTMDVYWKDGSVSSEQRTLRFEEGDRITSD